MHDNLIAVRVPEHVVGQLEGVQIQHDQRTRSIAQLARLDRA